MNYQSRGGYIPEAEAATPSSPSGKKGWANSTIRPLTLKSLVEAQVMPDGRLQLDSAEASSALVYGCVRQFKEGANYHDLVIEDGTNSITVRQYFNSDQQQPQAVFESGKWVRVSLTAKNMNQKVVYTATRVEPVHDFNEVLFHFVHCMHVHAHQDHASLQQPAAKMAHTESNLSNDNTGIMSGFAAVAGSLNLIQATVLKVYAEDKASEGMHISTVVRRLADKYAEDAVKQTVNWLLNEGYMYNTIDMDHAKSVME